MYDDGNGQLSAIGFYLPALGQGPIGPFFGGGSLGRRCAFDLEGNKVVRCVLYFGRQALYCPDATVDLEDFSGFIVAKVVHSSQSDPVLSVETKPGDATGLAGIRDVSGAESTPSVSYRALYFCSSSGIVDLRTMPQIPGYLP